MKKITAILIGLLAINVQLFAQSDPPKVVVGKPYPFINSNRELYLADASGFLMVKPWGKTIVIQKISTDLIMQKATEYNQFPKGFIVQGLLSMGKNHYLLYSAPANDKISVFAAQIDAEKGELLDGGREIVTSSDEIKAEVFSDREFQFILSEDESRFGVCYRLKSRKLDKSKSYEVNGYWVFDDQLNELWHGEFSLPYNEKLCDVRGRGIDLHGNILTAVSIFNDDSGLEKKAKEDFPNYSLQLLTYQAGSDKPAITPFNLNGKFLRNISIKGTREKIYCSGFYDSHQLNADPQGIFMFSVNNGTASETRLHPFSLDIVNEGLSKLTQKVNENKVKKNQPLDINNLKFVSSTPQADGSLLIQGEELVAGSAGHWTKAPGGVGTMNYGGAAPMSENILLAKLLPDCSLAWMRKLVKSQVSPSNGPSYKYWLSNDRYNFLFIEGDELIRYSLDPNTGSGEKQVLTKFRPLLKRPMSAHTLFLNRIVRTPDSKSVVIEAQVSGDEGRFGEVKPYKDNVLVKVMLD